MTDEAKKAFELTADLAKQLITLSTGVVALTITFSKDVVGNKTGAGSGLLLASWIVYILSIIFGVLTMMTLIGTLDPAPGTRVGIANKATESTVLPGNVRLTYALQFLLFLLATCLMIGFGFRAVRGQGTDAGAVGKADAAHELSVKPVEAAPLAPARQAQDMGGTGHTPPTPRDLQ